MSPFVRPIAFVWPRRLSASSAWIEHIPFAMNLVEVARPEVVVELGTHTGVSYCAFCQAVEATGLDTRCFAVDTWEGDEHSGRYGPDVLAELRAHHDPPYGRFSRLVQSTFGDAARHFADGQIDLLHIDGLHDYESVRRDFETWLPKMSRRGIVLFHDVNVRERGFGVWRLWAEVRGSRPAFEFLHGHGLGVLAVGPERPPDLEALFAPGDEDVRELRAVFHELGRRLSLEVEAGRLRALLAVREDALAERTRDLESCAARLRELESAADRARELGAALAASDAATHELSVALEARQCELDEIRASAAWRAVGRFRTTRDRLAPSGSMRRRFMDAVLSVRRSDGRDR